MNHLEFQNRVLHDKTIPSFVRLIASKALTDLRTAEYGTIHVENFVFWQLVKHSEAKAVRSGLYTFIRIFDDQSNSVDIQTLNS